MHCFVLKENQEDHEWISQMIMTLYVEQPCLHYETRQGSPDSTRTLLSSLGDSV